MYKKAGFLFFYLKVAPSFSVILQQNHYRKPVIMRKDDHEHFYAIWKKFRNACTPCTTSLFSQIKQAAQSL